MVTTAGVLYVVFGTLLFFFWVYGIVSFYYDLKRQILPFLREHRGDEEPDAEERELDREERLKRLYGDEE